MVAIAKDDASSTSEDISKTKVTFGICGIVLKGDKLDL
jgi:hypothetical protein